MKTAESVEVSTAISDGRLEVTALDAASLYVSPPNADPLTMDETHATLSVVGSDFETTVELDARQLDSLVDDLYDVQGGDD